MIQSLVGNWLPDDRYHRGHAERLRYSFERLPAIPDGGTVLSVGSDGLEAPLLQHLGAGRVVGIRSPGPSVPPRTHITITAPNGQSAPCELWALNAETEAWPDDLPQADVVIAWEVLEHCAVNPSALLHSSIRTLKTGGELSLTTPNALWHVLTIAQLFGTNALGTRFQPHIPFATHWRLYSPAEVAELVREMGCEPTGVTSFLRTAPYGWKGHVMQRVLELLRRSSGNGDCSYGQHVFVSARKVSDRPMYRPEWLFPRTEDGHEAVVAK